MTETIKFTHKGYIGFCPVLVSDIESDDPIVMARYWWLEPVLSLNEKFIYGLNYMCCLIDSNFEPYIKIKITEECDISFTFENN